MTQRNCRFDKTSQSSGCLGMTEIGLHRPDVNRMIELTVRSDNVVQCIEFNRISCTGTGPMSFNILNTPNR